MAEKKTSQAKNTTQAKNTKKTNTTAKKSTAASTRKKGYSATRRAAEKKRRMNPQVKAIILCAVSLLLFALVIIPGGSAWREMHRFLFGIFGFCAILIPFVFMYLGIMTAKEKEMAHKGAKIWLSITIVLFTATLIYMCGGKNYNEGNNYFGALGASYLGSLNPQDLPGVSPSLCGLLGTLLGYPMRALLTQVPSIIVSIVVILAAVMILFRVSLVDIANVAKKGYQKHIEHRDQRRERHEERLREREQYADDSGDISDVIPAADYTVPATVRGMRERIDIPLDKSGRRQRSKDAQELADDAQDQKILDILATANSGMATEIPEDEMDASAVARRITRKKSSNNISEGAKVADPETVQVDLFADPKRDEDGSKQINEGAKQIEEEGLDELFGRFLLRFRKYFVHSAFFNDDTVLNDRHPVADFLYHFHLVGNHYNGKVQPFIDVPQQLQNRFRSLGIQRRRSFVRQQHFRIGSQRPGYTNALLLPAGKLAGVIIRPVCQLHQIQQLAYPLRNLILRHPLYLQRKRDIIKNGTGSQQVKMLKDHADILAGFPQLGFVHSRQFLPVHKDLAACRYFQHVDATDQRGFSGAGQTDNAENFPLFNFNIRFLQGRNIAGFAEIRFLYVH